MILIFGLVHQYGVFSHSRKGIQSEVHNSPSFPFALRERIAFPLTKGTPVPLRVDANQKQMLTNLPAIYSSDATNQQPNLDGIQQSIQEIAATTIGLVNYWRCCKQRHLTSN